MRSSVKLIGRTIFMVAALFFCFLNFADQARAQEDFIITVGENKEFQDFNISNTYQAGSSAIAYSDGRTGTAQVSGNSQELQDAVTTAGVGFRIEGADADNFPDATISITFNYTVKASLERLPSSPWKECYGHAHAWVNSIYNGVSEAVTEANIDLYQCVSPGPISNEKTLTYPLTKNSNSLFIEAKAHTGGLPDGYYTSYAIAEIYISRIVVNFSEDIKEPIPDDNEVPIPGDNDWVNINGTVTYNGTPVCAMVLANGQYTFTCSGDGSFDLDVPLDGNGQITVFAFCSGLAPFQQVIYPSEGQGMQIELEDAEGGSGMDVTYTVTTINTTWVRLEGTVSFNGMPVCAMVLANGQYMFTCSGDGSFSLDVPLDDVGSITLFVFCSGLPPYKYVIVMDQINDYSVYSGEWVVTVNTNSSVDPEEIGSQTGTAILSVTEDGYATGRQHPNTPCGTVLNGSFSGNHLTLTANNDYNHKTYYNPETHETTDKSCCTGTMTMNIDFSTPCFATGNFIAKSCIPERGIRSGTAEFKRDDPDLCK